MSSREFLICVESTLNLQMSKREVMHLWKHLDRDGSGEVLCEEFIDFLFGNEDDFFYDEEEPVTSPSPLEDKEGVAAGTSSDATAGANAGTGGGAKTEAAGGRETDVAARLSAVEQQLQSLAQSVEKLTAALQEK